MLLWIVDAQHQSYRPITVLTFRWNYSFDGLNTYYYHIVNVVIHACASILFVRMVSLIMNPSRDVLLLAGLLFATHPVHVEVSGVCAIMAYSISIFLIYNHYKN